MNRHKAAMNLMGFVPALVVQYYSQQEFQRELPAKQSFRSVVMFTDISGFTNLTESLSRLGNEGPEVTAFVINRYMELLVKEIGKSGGDILKFAGDAMIVVWPPSTKTDVVEIHEDLRKVTRMALQNAIDIQGKLNDTCILHDIKLSVKIGFGVGDINIIYVGGVFGRSEYLATGEPLIQAFSSEHCASKGGQTIVSREVYNLVSDFFTFEEVPDHEGFYFIKLLLSQHKVKMKAEALLIKNSIPLSQFDRIKSQIQQYVPAALKPFIEIHQEKWGSEIRRVTTLFISLGIDLSDAKTDQGLQRIQNVVKTVQRCVYVYEGSLNKLLMDDKGSTVIVVFGLPPVSHQNDAVRAIQSAFLLEQELRKIKCKCAIGISTGIAFCGVVGTSGSRREYSILGDCVNLSARLMQMSTQPLSPVILIDETTAQESRQKIHCIFWNERKVKGKATTVQIFEPLHNFDDFRKVKDISTHYHKKKAPSVEDEALINRNTLDTKAKMQMLFKTKQSLVQSFNISPSPKPLMSLQADILPTFSLDSVSSDVLIGVEVHFSNMIKYIQQFTDDFRSKSQVQSKIIIVTGTYGIGKSYLVKNVLQKVEQINNSRKSDLLDIQISQLNPASKTKYLNSARIIFRNIFLSLAQRHNQQPNSDFILEIEPKADIKLLTELLSLGINEIETNASVQYGNSITELKRFTKAMIKMYLGYHNQKEPIMLDEHDQSQALILVIDDAQDTDLPSYQILKYMVKHFPNILLFLIIRDEFKEISAFSAAQNEPHYKDFVMKIQRMPHLHIKLKGLQSSQISILLSKYFGIKAFQCQEEVIQTQMFSRKKNTSSIHDYREMAELLNKLRDPLMFWESKPELEHMDFNMLCINYLYIMTKGHPLQIINIINTLLQGLVTFDIKKGIATVTEKLKSILQCEEWLQVDVPLSQAQVCGPLIDRLSALQQLILKQASVIGDIFDVQTLNFITPFKDQVNQKRLLAELQNLCDIDVLEVMSMEQENIYYRFKEYFYRNMLYQRMTFQQRRQTHMNVALALQKIPQPLDYHNKKEFKRLEFHWEQSSQKLQKISIHEKKQLIIKKIKQLLDNNLYGRSVMLNSGYLLKKSEKGITWNWRYCVIDSTSFIISQEDDNPEHCLTIPLKSVQMIEGDYKQESFNYYQLTVIANQSSRAGVLIEGLRKFYFALETNEELHEWMTYLEFAKAYSVYIDFVINFGRISFPITFTEYDFLIKAELDQEQRSGVRIGIVEHQNDKLSRKNLAVRPTLFGVKKYQSRKSSIFADGVRGSTVSSNTQNNNIVVQQDLAILKDRLKTFLIQSQQTLYQHFIATTLRKINSQRTFNLGQYIKDAVLSKNYVQEL